MNLRRRRSRHPAREPVGAGPVAPGEGDVVDPARAAPGGEDKRSSPGWFWSAAVAVSMVVLVVGVAGVKGWADYKSSRARAEELRQELQQVEESVHALELRIRELGPEGRLLEKVAREELGMIGPDEILVLLPPDTGS